MMITNRFTPKSPDNVRSGICRLPVTNRNKWNDANCLTDRPNFHCGYLSVFPLFTVIYESVLSIQFYLYGTKSQQQSPKAALWPLMQINGAIVQWQPLVSLSKHRSVFLTSACRNRWLHIFRFVLFLESWEQLWHQSLPEGFTLHNRVLCLPFS